MPEMDIKAIEQANEDKILDGILDKAGVSDEPAFYKENNLTPNVETMVLKEEPVEEPAGKESETKESAEKEEPASSEKDTRPQDSSPELKAAYKALRRDGVPYELLDKMSSESPEALLEWAEKARKRQDDVDSKLGSKDKESSEDNEVKGEEESESATSKDSSEESIDDTISELKEQFGDEAAEPLLKLNTQLQQQNEHLQGQIRAMQEAQLQDSLALSERVLSHLWPDLSTNRENIHQRMAQIGKEHPNEFSSVEQMMFAAAVDILGKPKSQENVAKQPNQSAAEPDPRDLGQPAGESGGNMPQAAMSTLEKEDAALEAILSGGGVDGAKRAVMQS